ncbi:hypothetical protein B484DRAFT_33858 [Ochromonadaceae sp. CCMP2298]|nr:hypothetical protein B484DRAFT_33858 [Ochromonadaceae sp. CCMP2298]
MGGSRLEISSLSDPHKLYLQSLNRGRLRPFLRRPAHSERRVSCRNPASSERRDQSCKRARAGAIFLRARRSRARRQQPAPGMMCSEATISECRSATTSATSGECEREVLLWLRAPHPSAPWDMKTCWVTALNSDLLPVGAEPALNPLPSPPFSLIAEH